MSNSIFHALSYISRQIYTKQKTFNIIRKYQVKKIDWKIIFFEFCLSQMNTVCLYGSINVGA